MPRKAAAVTESAADEPNGESTQVSRRSTRISSKPQSQKEEPKSKPKKRKADAGEGDDDAEDPEKSSGRKKKVKSTKMVQGSDDEASGAQIKIGDVLPAETKLKNEKDEDIALADLGLDGDKETKGVVLFLVPKADTPGCTTQACGFRDIYPDFSNTGFQVYCLSADKPSAQDKWKIKKSLPYPLLSDPERVLISALGAGEGGKTKRSHFVFTKQEDGSLKLVERKMPVKPADSPKLALDFIKNLNGEAKPEEVSGSAEKAEDAMDAEPAAAEA